MNNQEIQIRRAEHEDIEDIVKIEQDTFHDPWDKTGFFDALYYYPSTFFVIKTQGKIAGFICAGIENTGEEIYGHIMNVATLPEYRKQGIGGKLIQRIEYECLLIGATAVQLEVRVSNNNAQRFYRKMGYSHVFIIGGYYTNGEDAIVMMKWFTD